MIDLSTQQYNPLTGKMFSGQSGLQLIPMDDCARFVLRMSHKGLSLAGEAFGQELPQAINQMNHKEEKFALCLGPDEWLLLAPREQSKSILENFCALENHIPHSLVDISHRHVGLEIFGPGATRVLNAGCPLDLPNLPVGMCARSVFDKAQITLMKLEPEHYRLEIMYSFAQFVWQLLEKVVAENEAEIVLKNS